MQDPYIKIFRGIVRKFHEQAQSISQAGQRNPAFVLLSGKINERTPKEKMEETIKKKRRAVVTRPTVANELLKAGYKVNQIKSIWREDLLAWEFDLDVTSAKIVKDCYKKIGRPAPRAIQLFLKEGAADE